jgi:hypothetical protein
MATTPTFAGTPRCSAVATSSTTPVAVFTAGASGSRIERVRVTALGATTSQRRLKLIIFDGSAEFRFEEILADIIAAADAVAPWSASSSEIRPDKPLFLPAGYVLRAHWESSSPGSEAHVTAVGADF